mmetsp:Transcript_28538/g.43880  ORF Transcript_28538/g.43880 Transcript_28538/m.43880 type:complete len:149 (-) Transcript_28538:117-563(-)
MASLPMHQRRTANGNRPKPTNGSNGMYGAGRSRYGSSPGQMENGLSASDTNASIMEQQNNDRILELSDQVARLKGLTIDIGNEVKEQNALLDDMGDGFSATKDLLAGSLRRIGTMLERGGTKHMCYMVSFIVFVMVVLYWLMIYKSSS